MFGDEILVAPVIENQQKNKQVYLPSGTNWYDFWTNKVYKGGSWISTDINLETIPIFIKAGSFIPMTETVNSTDDYSTKQLTVTYYYDSSLDDNSYSMFDDDGNTFGSIERNEYELITIERKYINDNLTEFSFNSTGEGYEDQPLTRSIQMKLIGLSDNSKPEFLLNDNKLIKHNQPYQTTDGYYYDNKQNIWIINFIWNGEEIVIKEKK